MSLDNIDNLPLSDAARTALQRALNAEANPDSEALDVQLAQMPRAMQERILDAIKKVNSIDQSHRRRAEAALDEIADFDKLRQAALDELEDE